MRSFARYNRFPCFFPRFQAHFYVNPANDQYALLLLDFSGHVRDQLSITSVNLARFQRASEGTQHSASSCGDDVVNG